MGVSLLMKKGEDGGFEFSLSWGLVYLFVLSAVCCLLAGDALFSWVMVFVSFRFVFLCLGLLLTTYCGWGVPTSK